MKLKPSLFQLIVTMMTVSLLASCTRLSEASQSNCGHPSTTQQPYDCDNSNGHSGGHYGGSGRYRFGSSSNNGSSSPSKSTVGRSGFGSFGRGGHAGG